MSVSTKPAADLVPGDVVVFEHPENDPFSALVLDSSGSEFDAKVLFSALTSGQYIDCTAMSTQEVAVV